MRYFIHLSYNGTHYHGWQIQPNAASVQETLSKALSVVLNEKIDIVGAGRTDTGVHARNMFAHFDVNGNFESETIVYKLNSYLPKDIAIHQILRVEPDAHARFDARKRTYEYHVHTEKDVFLDGLSWFHLAPLDVAAMNEAANVLLQYSNFQSFSKVHTQVNTFNCEIAEARWTQTGKRLIFTISADRFLRNMVRAIVGTLVNVGLHKISLSEFVAIVEGNDRSKAGFSVPAHGLFLTNIEYDYITSPDRAGILCEERAKIEAKAGNSYQTK